MKVKKKLNSLLPFHPLTNVEMNEYYKNEPRFNLGTRWVSLVVKPKYTVYFVSFGIEHIPKEINKFIGNNYIKSNIFRIQAYD